MFAENTDYAGDWIVLPIGLSKSAIIKTPSNYLLLDIKDVSPIIITRNKFDHKGNFGHGLFIAGSSGKMGAAILGARAALRSGLGLITCHIPSSANNILQSSIPEAMVIPDRSEGYVSEIGNTDSFSAV
jgi:NAD(P)H-hydrate epimerase